MNDVKLLTFFLAVISVIFSSCSRPRNIDWQSAWNEREQDMKALTHEVKVNRSGIYKLGINELPDNFEYPFDQGFGIGGTQGTLNSVFDSSRIYIKYYIDRGVINHYSAFIYTNDSTEISRLDAKVLEGGNDLKLEDHWYIIND